MTSLGVIGLLLLPTTVAVCQQNLPASATYEQTWTEVWGLRPSVERVAEVKSLVLKRDVGRFTLENGKLYLLSTVGGRTVGAIFQGTGRFAFAPPTRIEQDRLRRFQKTPELDEPFSRLVLLFADTTLQELLSHLTFTPGAIPDGLGDGVKEALEYAGDGDSKSFDPDLMNSFLNHESNDLFYAHLTREGGGAPLMFMVNPFEFEGITLSTRRPRSGWFSRNPEVICRFPRQGSQWDVDASGERSGTATIHNYRMVNTLTRTGSSDLTFASAARIEITTAAATGPWVAFYLFEKLKLDSARTESGAPVTAFKGKDSPWLWIRLDGPLQAGDVRPITVYYHGDLIDRIIDFFYIKSESGWYPNSLAGRAYAVFDISYHTPAQYLLASVGERQDSTVSGDVLTTRWVTPEPIRNASFSLGLFEDYQVNVVDAPPVTVLISEEAHRTLSKIFVQQRHMREMVGSDVSRSLKFFRSVYGEYPVKRFYATEVFGNLGLAFPGMINLSWVTFQQTDLQGEDEVFRAHEVAHQWWGIGVDFSTYHDQWLSEGFANFSGLWYLQTSRADNDKYFNILRRWKANLFNRRDEPEPIWLGYRTSSSKDEAGYNYVVYEKGGWVLHMLRMLMIDLRTMNEDRFTTLMQTFYRDYRGKLASTEDFKRAVERQTGQNMDWFFNQWVYGSDIPTYRVAWTAKPADNGKYQVSLRVEQERVPPEFTMYVPVTIDMGGAGTARLRVKVTGAKSEIQLPLLPGKPKELRFNDLEGVLADVKNEHW